MKYACLNNISKVGLKNFTRKYHLTEKPEEADLILVRSQNMHDFQVSENLIAVARAGAGVNNISLDKMGQAGVVVFNSPGANSNAVKELVIAGMLIAARDVVGGINWVRENIKDENISKSVESAKKQFAGFEIAGKTISVIGLGAVGGKVANACVDLGMDVYGFDPYLSEKAKELLKPEIKILTDLEEMYKVADFMSLHLPLLDTTRGMFNESVWKLCKKGLIVLNFSRDTLVNDKSLEQAMEKGIVSKYVTDFPNRMTVGMKNVIAIPHLGASTEESEENCAVMAVNSLMVYSETGSIVNSVNFPNAELRPFQTKYRLCLLTVKSLDLDEKIDEILADYGQDIRFKVNKTRGSFAYFAYDMDANLDKAHLDELKELVGIYKVRIIVNQ